MESQEQIKEEEETSKWVVCPDSMMCKPESSKGLQQYAMHRDGKEEESYDLYRSSNFSQNPPSDVKPHNMVVNVKEESGENFGNNDISLPKNTIFNKIVDSSQTKSCTEQKTIHLVKPESSKGNQQCDVHPGSKEQSDYLYRRYDPSQDRSNDVKPYNMVVNIKEESGESFGNNNIYLPKNTVSINRVNLGKREPRTEQKTTHLIETVHADKTYSCDICGRAFKKMLGLKRHKNSHGKKVINGKKYFVCNTCDFQVTSKKHFDLHMKTHSQTCKSEPPKGTPQYAIHFGSKEDQSDRVSKSYDPSHNPPSDVKPYGKVVNIKEKSATRFAKFHNGGIVFDCDICGCLFEDLENLRKHMNQHQNHATSVQEQFVCNLCDYKVERKKDFELHMKIHSIEKPVVNIKEKSATHFAKTNNGELVFDCGICGCSFDDLEIFCKHMNQHQNHATSVQEHFVCNLCDYKVERMKDFELHMKVHSIEKPFCCNICDYSFSEFGNLIKHMKTHPKKKKVPTATLR